jgi:desulfoferrodoxin-like iron-binding protein
MTKFLCISIVFFHWTVSVGGFCLLTSRSSCAAAKTVLFATPSSIDDPVDRRKEVSRRVALVMAAATVAAGGKLDDAVAIPLSGKVEALEYENIEYVNLKGAPEKHLPIITLLGSSNSKIKVKVVVPHVMDSVQPHFIEYVWLKDEENNKVIKAKHLLATDPSPPTLTVAGVVKGTKVRALLFCNLHGLWQGDAFTV